MSDNGFTEGDFSVSFEPSNGLVSEDDAWAIIAMDNSDNEPWHVAAVWRDTQGGDDESLSNARLFAASKKLYEACAEFVRKVDIGEARSTRSYRQMKEAMEIVDGVDDD